MKTNQENSQSSTARVGWGILLGVSALLILVGIFWYIELPAMALDNIAEHTSLEPDGFMVGEPSAFAIITLLTRNSSVYTVGLGFFALLVAWQGYRHGSRWAWTTMWVLVAIVWIIMPVIFGITLLRQ